VGNGVFELANVTLDKRLRTVSFPAVLNQDHGPMEYFLVTGYGKVHESILRTDAFPYHIHIAMLLLDARDSRAVTNSAASAQKQPEDPNNHSSQLVNPSKEDVPGDRISIEVSWKVDGREVTRKAEELVFNLQKKTGLQAGAWAYNGSEVFNGRFTAQESGSIVSLVTDTQALVNSRGDGHDNDRIWAANTNSLPAFNTPLRVTFRLPRSETAK
jgi:hypothetical protein